jgi:AcrR family transcriptional regulator
MPTPRNTRTRISVAELPDQPLPAKQQRSRETTERLLLAAEELLRSGGADAATLRAIADRAGVSLSIVYRRFPDKDAVLRAVYTRYFNDVASTNARALTDERLQGASLEQLSAALVAGIANGYRRDPALLRALVLYARTHEDPDFRERAAALNASAFAGIRRLVESHRREIGHPTPKVAVSFAISAAASVLSEHILFSDVSSLPRLSHRHLTAEVTRLFLSYLTTSGSSR